MDKYLSDELWHVRGMPMDILGKAFRTLLLQEEIESATNDAPALVRIIE